MEPALQLASALHINCVIYVFNSFQANKKFFIKSIKLMYKYLILIGVFDNVENEKNLNMVGYFEIVFFVPAKD